MRPWTFLLSAIALGLCAARTAAGEINSVLNVGDPAPAWTDLAGVDGKKHSLADLRQKEVVIVVFTCNSCPIATDYEDRIIAFARKFAGPGAKAGLVAINVNTIEEDRLPKMKERAAAKGFPFPYLYDPSQKIARLYGAIFTPEFFVLDRERKIAFMGGFDDNSDPSQVKKQYLAPAVEAVLQGTKPKLTEAPCRGCQIRFERPRRRKPAT